MNSMTQDREFKLGRLANLDITATFSALVGMLILWGILSAFAFLILKLPAGMAILGGLVATVLHFFSELWHQLGHAWVACGTGYPMTGIRFGFLGVLSAALYPHDEPALPAHVHIRRALGGPLASLGMSVIAVIIFLVELIETFHERTFRKLMRAKARK